MTAQSELVESLSSVRALIALESKYDDPPSDNDRSVVYALRGSCILLSVASFEQYLKSLFEEQLQKLVDNGVTLSRAPEKLRVEAYWASLELALDGDHSTRDLEKRDRLGHVASAARAVAADSFNPAALSRTYSNPNPACVIRMFKSVGVAKVFDRITPAYEARKGRVAATYVSDRLQNLVDSRNVVAHSADAAHIARSDLEPNVEFFETLGQVLEDILRPYIDGIVAPVVAASTSTATQTSTTIGK